MDTNLIGSLDGHSQLGNPNLTFEDLVSFLKQVELWEGECCGVIQRAMCCDHFNFVDFTEAVIPQITR